MIAERLRSVVAASWSRYARYLFQTLFLAGLVLCAVAAHRTWIEATRSGNSVSPWAIASAAAGLGIAWLAAVAAWRRIYSTFVGRPLSWPDGLRHSGLILIGKYVPGGVVGFLARVYDDAGSGGPRTPHVVAGLYEQLQNVLVTGLAGLVLYMSALLAEPRLLTLLVLVAPVSCGLMRLGILFVRRTKPGFTPVMLDRVKGAGAHLMLSAVLMLISALAWFFVVAVLAISFAAVNSTPALGLAGAFGLAVVFGIAIVILPGGIGAREGAFVALASAWLPVASAIGLAGVLRLAAAGLDVCAGATALVLHRKSRSRAI